MPSGGKRPNSGRKKLPDDIKRHKVNFYVTYAERDYLRDILKQKRILDKHEPTC